MRIATRLGTYFSYHFDVSTGGAIVVLLTVLFMVAMVFAPKYGILAQSFRRHQPVLEGTQGKV